MMSFSPDTGAYSALWESLEDSRLRLMAVQSGLGIPGVVKGGFSVHAGHKGGLPSCGRLGLFAGYWGLLRMMRVPVGQAVPFVVLPLISGRDSCEYCGQVYGLRFSVFRLVDGVSSLFSLLFGAVFAIAGQSTATSISAVLSRPWNAARAALTEGADVASSPRQMANASGEMQKENIFLPTLLFGGCEPERERKVRVHGFAH